MSPARLELAVEWRQRRWRRLLDIIDQLPRDSRYIEAVSLDEDVAEALLEHDTGDDRKVKPVRRMSEWSPTVELLTAILNRLAEVAQAIAALGGAKPRAIPSAPMPTSVLERMRKRRRERQHKALMARILPHETQVDPESHTP